MSTMNFENGDPFNEASPSMSLTKEPDTYDDLLGFQVPVEDFDLSMPDFEVEFTQSPYRARVANMMSPQDQNIDTTDNRQGPGPTMMELCNLDANPAGIKARSTSIFETTTTVPQESGDIATTKPNGTSAIVNGALSSQDAGHGIVQSSRLSQKALRIKTEALDTPFTSEIQVNTKEEPIEISDTEDPDSIYKHGTKMSDGVIVLSDGEDLEEIIIFDDGSSSVAVKKENPDVELLGATRGLVEIADFGLENDKPSTATLPKLDKSFLRTPNPRVRRTPADITKMRQIQRLCAEKARVRNLGLGTGKAPATPKVLQSLAPDSPSHSTNDEYAWMNGVVAVNDSSATGFSELKKAYKAKRKGRRNTLEEDVQFKKAQIEENQRLKRLAQEAADTDSDDEAEESDDGLFLPQESSLHSKRPFSTMMVITDSDDDDDNDKDGGVPTKSPFAKRSKPSRTDLSTKKSRAKALQKELRYNMLAGIEASILKDQKRDEYAAANAKSGDDGSRQAFGKARKANPPDLSAKRTKTGRMNNIGSLTTSNIYGDSNANLDRQALPVITEKKKKDFMSSLIANIPLEDQKQAKSDKNDILKASTLLGPRKVFPDGQGSWTFKGMRSSLFHYQLQGAGYMRSREAGEKGPYGGILADAMGLGKTVQMIATMLANRQTDPELPKCTLIVCSPALMGQWEEEIELHLESNIFKRIVRHHANTKFSGKGAELEMERADVILTTYGEVARSYPKCDIPKDLRNPAEKEAWWSEQWEKKRGLLHRAQFHRVVLDEAQVIKNHHSQTSIACRALMAKLRWCITGTPIANRLTELFPYFKFLRVRHTGSICVFRDNFCLKDSDVCNKRLHSFLDGLMIRRTHQDTLLGAPLIKLPKTYQETLRLKFNSVERGIYEIVRIRCIRAINAAARNGTLEEQQTMVIACFQRLRQMVAHIFMVQEVVQKASKKEEDTAGTLRGLIFSEATDISKLEDKMLKGLRKMVANTENDVDSSDTVPLFLSPDDSLKVPKAGKKSSDLIYRFSKDLKEMKKKSKWSELRERTLCHTCGEPPEEPWVTGCLHLYCRECLENLAYEAAQLDLDETACHKCGTIYTESLPCEGLKELAICDLSASVFQGNKDKAPVKKKFKLTMDYVDSKEYGVVLSTKTLAVKAQLGKWMREDPDRKIIVFTDWLMVMHVLARICQKEGWKCCHYNGKLSHRARDQSLSAFRDPKSEVKILIASLKCGGTGLNLTVASRVICVDLWYNTCVEQQAFARVHRIGQKEETYITRCVVKDTVDERLLKMQEEKMEIISNAMDDRSVMAKLTLPELMKLFGPVAYDENSKPFILVDDDVEPRSKRPTTSSAEEDPMVEAT